MIAALLSAATIVSSPPGPGDPVRLGVLTERQGLVRVYLAPTAAKGVRSPLDRRLHYIGSGRARNGRVTVSFHVPPYAGRYRAWCAGCGFGGRLQVAMPAVGEGSCPATVPRTPPPPGLGGTLHGNDSVWTRLPEDGILTARPQDLGQDGSIWTKWFWYAGVHGSFSLSGRRIDATSPPLVVHRINQGSQTGWSGATWATPMTFPAAGCWRLTARVATATFAVSLSFVLKVQA